MTPSPSRRRVLHGLALSLGAALAGCAGSGPRAPPDDEVVAFEDLPPDARAEFRTALEQGGYRACDLALLDVEEPVVEYRDGYYTRSVQHGDTGNATGACDGYFLQVERWAPSG